MTTLRLSSATASIGTGGVNDPYGADAAHFAETASVFGETFRSMLTTSAIHERKAMLASRLNARSQCAQIAFTNSSAPSSRAPQQRVTTEQISPSWMNRTESLGPAIALRPAARPGLYRAFHPFAVLRLRLCVRRLPGEFAVQVYGRSGDGFASDIWRCSRAGSRILLTARAFRNRRAGSGLLEVGLSVIERMIAAGTMA